MPFSNIIGQQHAKSILEKLIQQRHFPPLLFVGPKGVGKRTTAINFAQIINCPESDDIEINQCLRCRQIGNLTNLDIKLLFPIPQKRSKVSIKISNGSDRESPLTDARYPGFTTDVTNLEKEKTQTALAYLGEHISDYALGKTRPDLPVTNYHPIEIIYWLKTEMSYKPVIGRNKIVIIVEADRMRSETANALLKTLEEPQQDTLFILTAERIASILPTILSRCQIIRFQGLSSEQIIYYLTAHRNIPKQKAGIAATLCVGSLRKALLFVENEDAFLPNPKLIRILDREQVSPSETLQEISRNEFEEFSAEKIISALIFVYRSAMLQRLNLDSFYESVVTKKIVATLTLEQIANRILFLLNALNDANLNLNKKLYLFSILTAVRL